jgi:uncharacterized membrane protein YedE/YeeE
VRNLAALVWGTLFGVGLEISGMTNPAKVLAFLDVFGHWDATLACVMGAALAVSAAGYQLARRRSRAWLGSPLELPTRRDLDARLLGGAALFGVGWGLVGLCPGPALANLARGSGEIALFVAAMLAGVGGHRFLTRAPRAEGSAATI